ncbi:putative RNA-binding protein involved in heterochromatin assembly [Nakaseomyces bracarensis]|uniref:RNA-binding protein involved in heterochromatin assembly n=1 Tax=Nakaseomyces bracarensis TaxID=273131 RepID=A0ABR4NVY4_9SACH
MHYVILEIKTKGEDVHDLALSEFGYQIIDSETLVPCIDPTIFELSDDDVSLKDAIKKLIADIEENCEKKENIVDSEHPNEGAKNFVFCTLNSNWDIRVNLIHAAQKENIDLPSYLIHPVIFDLRKEFSLWLINHPQNKESEQMNEVDTELQSRPKSTNNNDDEHLALIINSLKITTEYNKLIEDINDASFSTNLTRIILIALHENCTSEEDELTILTRPYDLELDYRNFLEEGSKVVYINNIPAETTQNDLENWFNTYNLKPIGCWTLRNFSDGIFLKSQKNSNSVASDNIIGFIIFQSHDDARLSVNENAQIFRVSNSKNNKTSEELIEIQPSSIKLLEKVQDNLVPFPQNKNKPRPGDWNCPSCGFSNFQRRTACFRCSFPIPNSVSGNLNKYSNPPVNNNSNLAKGYGNLYNRPSSPQLNWNKGSLHQNYQLNQQQQKQQQQLQHLQQVQQTYQMYAANRASNNIAHSPLSNTYRYNFNGSMNNANTYTSNSYNKLNQGVSNNAVAYGNLSNVQNMYNSNTNMGIANSNTNNNNVNTIHTGSNVPFRAGDWKCISCFYHNFAKNIVCLRCGGPKSLNETKQNQAISEKHLNNGDQMVSTTNKTNTAIVGDNSQIAVQYGLNAAYPYLNASSGNFNDISADKIKDRQEVRVSNL